MVVMTMLLAMAGITSWAQSAISDIPREINANDAVITKLGHATLTMTQSIVKDAQTGRVDTLRSVTHIEWNTEPGTAKRRNAEQRDGFYDHGSSWWYDMHWYTYDYPSINADGQPLILSSMACMPDEDCDYVNGVIIGCHITIASNGECPSQYNTSGTTLSDVGMMMMHASSGTIHASESDNAYYSLVILPDYEGYGVTRDLVHPYIYQELTARQVVDATRYGIALYNTDSQVNSIRHPFRSDWRSVCVGYSQGGAVALATQRFIEQNGLTDELRLTGSVCGDGPYDLISTLMYYTERDNNGEALSMPVVLPLILKSMCATHPYMRNHHESDYFVERFLETGILTWLEEKELDTDEITEAWQELYDESDYFHSVLTSDGKAILGNIVKPELMAYLRDMLAAHPDYASVPVPLPAHRGLVEDVHYALETNCTVRGWQPQHAIFLYHSYEDTVVPEVNRESAGNALGEWVIKLHASVGSAQFDHVGTGREFFVGTEEPNAIRALSDMPYYQTLDDVRNLKDNYNQSSLDDFLPSSGMADGIVKGTLLLNGDEITAEYTLSGMTATLGTGYNACISQYSEGEVVVPETIVVEGTTYPVIAVAPLAFLMCTLLTRVTLPEGLTHVGDFAFVGCRGIQELELPSTLTAIGSGAFIDLPSLQNVVVYAKTPPVWEYNDVFCFHVDGIGDSNAYHTADVTLYVPEGKDEIYRNANFTNQSLGWTTPDGWGYFYNIIEMYDAVGENDYVAEKEVFAYYSNGQIIVSNDGESVLQLVDVAGHVIISEQISGNSTLDMDKAPGLYLLRLVNGEKVRTQKIVVR